jgi:hypothetical protein
MNQTLTPVRINLCTLFDENFLAQGLTMIESVENNSNAEVVWTILAMDEATELKLQSLNRSNMTVIQFRHFPDLELKALATIRPWRELCWTSAACLLNFCLNLESDAQYVGYIDADCFFLSNIAEMLVEIPHEKEFAIHEHNYSPDRMQWLEKSGRFNVGVIIGKPKSEFLKCVSRWRIQVLDRCDVNVQEGRCGDQTYLNDWPDKYPSLHVFQSVGVGVAPWNLNNYQFTSSQNEKLVNLTTLYFFHFHGLQYRTLWNYFAVFVPAAGYQLRYVPLSEVYLPYVRAVLLQAYNLSLHNAKLRFNSDLIWLFRNTLRKRIRLVARLRVSRNGEN